MKKLLFAILFSAPLYTNAQDLYLTGGYSTDNPRIKDGTGNGYGNMLNGETLITDAKQSGFFAGIGANFKSKKTSSLGLRIEVAYERYNFEMATTVRAQLTPFQAAEEFPYNISESNSYLRLSPTLTYYKLKHAAINYQFDLGFSQFIRLNGWQDNSSFTAVHISAGMGYSGVIFKLGTDLGMRNMLSGVDKDYNVRSRRFFAGVNIYPFVLKGNKPLPEPEVIKD